MHARPGQNPVVLIHGTWEAYNNWAMLSPALKDAGSVRSELQGHHPSDGGAWAPSCPTPMPPADITPNPVLRSPRSSTRVRPTSTGAAKVNMVGRSGESARQYIRYDGGKDKVANLVTLGATQADGTTVLGFGYLAAPSTTSASTCWALRPS